MTATHLMNQKWLCQGLDSNKKRPRELPWLHPTRKYQQNPPRLRTNLWFDGVLLSLLLGDFGPRGFRGMSSFHKPVVSHGWSLRHGRKRVA